MTTYTYKRQFRELSDETRQKISMANKNRPKSETHKQHISQAMKDYWSRIPSRNTETVTCQGEGGYKNDADNEHGQC